MTSRAQKTAASRVEKRTTTAAGNTAAVGNIYVPLKIESGFKLGKVLERARVMGLIVGKGDYISIPRDQGIGPLPPLVKK